MGYVFEYVTVGVSQGLTGVESDLGKPALGRKFLKVKRYQT
jgi:hypothetical protein